MVPKKTTPRLLTGPLVQANGAVSNTGTVSKNSDEHQTYLTVKDLAGRYRCSERSIRELTRLNRIPLQAWPGTRRILFHGLISSAGREQVRARNHRASAWPGGSFGLSQGVADASARKSVRR